MWTRLLGLIAGPTNCGDPFQTLLDLVEFAASANVPMFNVLPLERLDPGQQARSKRAAMDYCARVLIPSFGIFNEPGLKAACAELQSSAIRRQLAAGDTRPIDHYNLALALSTACLQQGKIQHAIVYLTRALIVNPQDNESRYYLELAKKQCNGHIAPALPLR
jgi:hypothetical protein